MRILTFTRFKFNLDGDMKFIHQVWVIGDTQHDFQAWLVKMCDVSREAKSYINFYEMVDYEPYLFKLGFIKEGQLLNG